MSLEALHRVLWHPVSAEGALGMFASSCYDFYWAHQPALLCPHRLTRETASQVGAPALCTEKSDSEYLMISTFYLPWWQIATQYCTITQSTLLMKPYKCHSAEVYALPDFTAPSSSRRENTCAGPGLTLTLYLELSGDWSHHRHLETGDPDHAPMLTTASPGPRLSSAVCNAKLIISFRVLPGF